MTGGRYDPATDTWQPTSTVDAPPPRAYHTAVWAGTQMVVWGGWDGSDSDTYFGDGGRYDPVTDTWQPTSTTGAPSNRCEHTAIWTGSEMIVWGGGNDSDGSTYFNDGGRYDPVTDTWQKTLYHRWCPAPKSRPHRSLDRQLR